jgi:hypothetical protein
METNKSVLTMTKVSLQCSGISSNKTEPQQDDTVGGWVNGQVDRETERWNDKEINLP